MNAAAAKLPQGIVNFERANARRAGLALESFDLFADALDRGSTLNFQVYVAERLRMASEQLQERTADHVERLAEAGLKIVALEKELELQKGAMTLLDMENGDLEGQRDQYKEIAVAKSLELGAARTMLRREREASERMSRVIVSLLEDLNAAEAELKRRDDEDGVEIEFIFGGAPGLGPDAFSDLALVLYSDLLGSDESE